MYYLMMQYPLKQLICLNYFKQSLNKIWTLYLLTSFMYNNTEPTVISWSANSAFVYMMIVNQK
jgi:hypothetical protein